MASRFYAPAAGIGAADALHDMMLERETRKRQAEADQMAREREARLRASGEQDDELRRQQIEANKLDIESRIAARTATQAKAERDLTLGDIEAAGVGGELSGDAASRAVRLTPGLVSRKAAPLQMAAVSGAPEGVLPPSDAGAAAPMPTPPPGVVSKGTQSQQAIQGLLGQPNLTDAQRNAVRLAQATNDFSGLAQLFRPEEAPETKIVLRASADRRTIERQEPDGKWVVHTGPVPANAHWLQEPTPREAGGSDNPYHHMVSLADGVYMVDSTNPANRIRIGDIKPGETAQREIANARTLVTMTGQIVKSVRDEWVGPMDGRWKTAEAAITGGDPQFAAFAATVASIRNAFINLRTGAAMAEPEAARIAEELADVRVPIKTFVARAKNAQNYLETWLKNRASIAYGRTTTGDVDNMVGGGQPTTPAAAPAAKPTAADLIKKYRGQ